MEPRIIMIGQTSMWDSWLIMAFENGYYRGFNLILWILVCIVMFASSLIFFNRARNPKLIESQRANFLAFGFLMLFMDFTRISFIFSYFFESYYNFLLALGYAFAAISLFPAVYVYEKFIITKTKHFFTIFSTIFVVIATIFLFKPAESDLSLTIQQIGMPVIAASFFILYIWMIRKSAGDVRKKSLKTLVGMIIWSLGIIFDSESLVASLDNFLWLVNLAAICMILGTIVITATHKLN